MTKLSRIQKRKRKEVLTAVVIFVAITALFVYTYFDMKKDEEQLRQNWVITDGKVFKVVRNGKTADYANYLYIIDGEEFVGKYYNDTKKVSKRFSNIKQKSWVVIYDSTDYENSELLLQPKDFEKYNIPYSGQEVIRAW